MTIHVNIGQAKTRLSELIAAAVRGEEIVLDKAGMPQVRLVPVDREEERTREDRAHHRRSAFGMWKELVGDRDIDIAQIKRNDSGYQAAVRERYGDPD